MHVLVTGANGHLGYNLVKTLLARGHAVRASVRRLTDQAKSAPLAALGNVEIVEGDLDRPATIRAAMEGVDAVVHAAAIYVLMANGREQEIIDASVKGVEVALRAARDAGVKKVVLTSSIVTLPLTRRGEAPVTEADWATDLRAPYVRAKTEGERRAWELSKALKVPLVSILPGAFGGPGFQTNTPTIDLIESIMRGALSVGVPPLNFPYCDVRDVARAHALALEQDCSGRFVASNATAPMLAEIAALMHAIDPKVPRPGITLPSFVMGLAPLLDGIASRLNRSPRTLSPEMAATVRGKIWNASNARIEKELGWRPEVPLKTSLADTMATIRANRAEKVTAAEA